MRVAPAFRSLLLCCAVALSASSASATDRPDPPERDPSPPVATSNREQQPPAPSAAPTPSVPPGPSVLMLYGTAAGQLMYGTLYGAQLLWGADDHIHVGLDFNSGKVGDDGHGRIAQRYWALDLRAEAHVAPAYPVDFWVGIAAGYGRHTWREPNRLDDEVRESAARFDTKLAAGFDLRLMLGRVNIILGPSAAIGPELFEVSARMGFGFR